MIEYWGKLVDSVRKSSAEARESKLNVNSRTPLVDWRIYAWL